MTATGFEPHSHLVRKRTLSHLAKLASLAKWLSVRLRTKLLWIRIPLLSPKHQISHLFRLFIEICSETRSWHDNNIQTLNPICICGLDSETLNHFFLHRPKFADERQNLLLKIERFIPKLFRKTDNINITSILLYGDPSFAAELAPT